MISKRIKRSAIVALTLGVVIALATTAWGNGRILHRVSVGGPDSCGPSQPPNGPGCDASFSLIAIQFDDLTVTGEYVDQFGHGNGGLHGPIDCLAVSGNVAFVGGVLTSKFLQGEHFFVKVVDNGTSANDPPDRISFSNVGDFGGATCEDLLVRFPDPNQHTNPMPQGQVKVM